MSDPTSSEPENGVDEAPAAPAAVPSASAEAPAPPPAGPPPRAPRERWINPARRTAFIAITIVTALVLLFIGAVVGHVIGVHQVSRFGGPPEEKIRPFGPYGQNGKHGQFPLRPYRPGPSTLPTRSASSTPASPSGTATS
jgi:hypothetical protein